MHARSFVASDLRLCLLLHDLLICYFVCFVIYALDLPNRKSALLKCACVVTGHLIANRHYFELVIGIGSLIWLIGFLDRHLVQVAINWRFLDLVERFLRLLLLVGLAAIFVLDSFIGWCIWLIRFFWLISQSLIDGIQNALLQLILFQGFEE